MQAFIIASGRAKHNFRRPSTSRRRQTKLSRLCTASRGPVTPLRFRSVQFGFFRCTAITKNNSRRIGESDPKRRATDRQPRGFEAPRRPIDDVAAGAGATLLWGHGRGHCCQPSCLRTVLEVRAERQATVESLYYSRLAMSSSRRLGLSRDDVLPAIWFAVGGKTSMTQQRSD